MRNLVLMAATLALAIGFAASASAEDAGWLKGTWSGTLEGSSAVGGKYGNDRSLVINSVSADGTSAQGLWVAGSSKSKVTVNVSGSHVTFTTGSAHSTASGDYALDHQGNALSGTYKYGAKSGNLTLTKQN